MTRKNNWRENIVIIFILLMKTATHFWFKTSLGFWVIFHSISKAVPSAHSPLVITNSHSASFRNPPSVPFQPHVKIFFSSKNCIKKNTYGKHNWKSALKQDLALLSLTFYPKINSSFLPLFVSRIPISFPCYFAAFFSPPNSLFKTHNSNGGIQT